MKDRLAPVRPRRRSRRGAVAVVLAAMVAFTAQSSSQANEYTPGLPDASPGFGLTYGAAAQGGIAYTKRAKQWFRSPDGMVTFSAGTAQTYTQTPNGPQRHDLAMGEAFFVSPKGAPAPYGYLAPMTVRSVGFGLMPVEATVQISQRRADGYPIPVKATLVSTKYIRERSDGQGLATDEVSEEMVIEDAFNVRILQVKVDGVDVGLTGNCQTVTPAPFRLVGPEYTIEDRDQPPHNPSLYSSYVVEWFATHDPETYYHPTYGGTLKGTITIPPFTGCTTKNGDDMSPLITLAASGPDNPISGRTGFNCSPHNGDPLSTGASSPKLTKGLVVSQGIYPDYCFGTKTFDYPDRP